LPPVGTIAKLSTEQTEQQAEAKLLAKYQAKTDNKATLATDEAAAATEIHTRPRRIGTLR
jgi:hypothetical protein